MSKHYIRIYGSEVFSCRHHVDTLFYSYTINVIVSNKNKYKISKFLLVTKSITKFVKLLRDILDADGAFPVSNRYRGCLQHFPSI